ncbi:hypothetical protein GCM10023148_18440 [Actinokineospora soli]
MGIFVGLSTPSTVPSAAVAGWLSIASAAAAAAVPATANRRSGPMCGSLFKARDRQAGSDRLSVAGDGEHVRANVFRTLDEAFREYHCHYCH